MDSVESVQEMAGRSSCGIASVEVDAWYLLLVDVLLEEPKTWQLKKKIIGSSVDPG